VSGTSTVSGVEYSRTLAPPGSVVVGVTLPPRRGW
jgi:hypothetical protein